jgi:hypothetical protein
MSLLAEDALGRAIWTGSPIADGINDVEINLEASESDDKRRAALAHENQKSCESIIAQSRSSTSPHCQSLPIPIKCL